MRPDPRPRSPSTLHDEATGMNPSGGPLIRVATGCASIDAFVADFAALASEEALVVPASSPLAVGTEGRFAIVLRDRSVAMRGRCRVTDARPTLPSRSRPAVQRTLLRLSLLEMDEATRAVHTRLLVAQRLPAPRATATQRARDRFETRTPGAPLTLPANPFSGLGAHDLASFIECALFETDAEVEGAVSESSRALVATPPAVAARARGDLRRGRPASHPPRGAASSARIAVCAACAIAGIAAGLILRSPTAARIWKADSSAVVAAAPATPAPAPTDTVPRVPATPPTTEPVTPPVERRAVTREVTPEPDAVTKVSQELRRPTAALVVGSSPPGAEITVNGASLGPAPVRIEVPRFEPVDIQATLAGYLPWTRTLYVRQLETRVGMKLTPVAHDVAVEGAVGEADTDESVHAGRP